MEVFKNTLPTEKVINKFIYISNEHAGEWELIANSLKLNIHSIFFREKVDGKKQD